MTKQELINWLYDRDGLYKQNVQHQEDVLRNTDKESFYYLHHLKEIHKLNAKRELIKEILDMLGE